MVEGQFRDCARPADVLMVFPAIPIIIDPIAVPVVAVAELDIMFTGHSYYLMIMYGGLMAKRSSLAATENDSEGQSLSQSQR